jgi:hypothetical protein
MELVLQRNGMLCSSMARSGSILPSILFGMLGLRMDGQLGIRLALGIGHRRSSCLQHMHLVQITERKGLLLLVTIFS